MQICYHDLVIEISISQCLRCEYSWQPRKEHVKECPKCKSPYWNKKKKHLSYEKKNELLALSEKGITTDITAKKFGLSQNRINRILRNSGIKNPNQEKEFGYWKKWSNVKKELKLIMKNNNGKLANMRSFVRKAAYSINKIHGGFKNVYKKFGVFPDNRKYFFDENSFDGKLNEEKIYWLGFIVTDGCLYQNDKYKSLNFHLDIKDTDHLEKFNKFLNSNVPLYFSYNKKQNTKSVHLSLRSDKLFNDLIKFGITPRKSLILKHPKNIVNHLLSHFYRGCVDGDGCLWFDEKRKQYKIGLVGTKSLLNGFKKWLQNNGFFTKIEKMRNVYSIQIGGNRQVEKIANLLYKNSNIFLDRKYKNYQNLIKFNNRISL